MIRVLMITSLTIAACGVPDGKLLADLKDNQLASVCEEFSPRTIVCEGEEVQETIAFGERCPSAPSTCAATVGNFRDCHEQLELMTDEDYCETENGPQECYALLTEGCLTEE